MLLFGLVEHVEKFFFRFRGAEFFYEILFREKVHEAREHVDV